VIINAAAFLKDTNVVGPGLRDALWVQGCTIRCPGCANQAFLPHRPRRALEVNRLLAHFARRRGQIDGLSVLGGEPTEQAPAVAALLEGVQSLGFSTVVFTGRTLEELEESGDAALLRLLAATDLLIDGPFRQAERDSTLHWRGSRNQRLHYLTPRLRGLHPEGCSGEVVVSIRGILLNGVGTRALVE